MRQLTDPTGRQWEIEEIARGSGFIPTMPKASHPAEAHAMVQVTAGAERFVARVPLDWPTLDDAALWALLERGRR
ncbi:MAG TPA: hypothetical protein VFS28_03640 [Gemmatimonadales bacterium]|jgi:hypothetical protein|nr:hypothetical protein [Gemmatimonadales bacterium]